TRYHPPAPKPEKADTGTGIPVPRILATVRVRDGATGRILSSWTEPQGGYALGPFSPDGKLLAVRSGKELLLKDTETGADIQKVSDQCARATAAFHPSGQRLAFIRAGRTKDEAEVAIWDRERGAVTQVITGFEQAYALAYTPDGRRLVVA